MQQKYSKRKRKNIYRLSELYLLFEFTMFFANVGTSARELLTSHSRVSIGLNDVRHNAPFFKIAPNINNDSDDILDL